MVLFVLKGYFFENVFRERFYLFREDFEVLLGF